MGKEHREAQKSTMNVDGDRRPPGGGEVWVVSPFRANRKGQVSHEEL